MVQSDTGKYEAKRSEIGRNRKGKIAMGKES
jgi:hypothetical protein